MGEQRDPIVEAARRLVAVWDERQFGLMSWHALVGAAYVELRDTILRAEQEKASGKSVALTQEHAEAVRKIALHAIRGTPGEVDPMRRKCEEVADWIERILEARRCLVDPQEATDG